MTDMKDKMKNKEFKYGFTLINVTIIIIFSYSIYQVVINKNYQVEGILLIIMTIYIIPIFFIDLILQVLFRKSKLKLFISNVVIFLILIIWLLNL